MANTSTRAPGRRATLAAMAALILAVVVASPLHSPLNNPNEGVRVFTVKALVEHHTLAIDDVTKAWGFIDDKARHGGHTYQSKAPLPALLAAALYAVVHPITGDLSRPALTRLCRVGGSGVPVAVLVALTWWSLRRGRRQQGDGDDDDGCDGDGEDDDAIVDSLIVGLVLGTGVLASLNVFSGHAIAAVAPAAIIALARLPGPPSPWSPALAGVLFAVAATSEYPAALSAPLVLLVVRRFPSHLRLRQLGLAVVAACIAMLPTLVAHHLMWGAPWRTGYSFLDNPHYRPLVEGTFFGIGLPDLRVLATTLLSPELGLFWFSPFLLLGLLGLRRWSPLDRAILVLTMLAFLAFIAGFRGWRGGWSVGPRYILELAGILTVLAVDGVRTLPARVRLTTVTVLVGMGVLHSGLAGAFFPHLPDVLRAPVGELVLPLIWRGFAPDSLPLLLGVSSSTSALLVAAIVLLPAFVVALLAGAPRAAIAGVLVVAAVAVLEVQLVPVDGRRGLEVRRVMDNWRPEAGIPFSGDLVTAPSATRLGIDRRREVKGPLECAEAPRPRRRDVGPGTDAIRAAIDAAPPGSLVVVDDALADHIASSGGSALVVAVADLTRLGPVPCSGDVTVVLRQDRSLPGPVMPAALRDLPPAGAPTEHGGFVVQRLQRAAR